jgi:hypothetical protein
MFHQAPHSEGIEVMARSSFTLLTPVFSPPLMTFPTEKYNKEHNIIYTSQHTEIFWGTTEIVTLVKHQIQK